MGDQEWSQFLEACGGFLLVIGLPVIVLAIMSAIMGKWSQFLDNCGGCLLFIGLPGIVLAITAILARYNISPGTAGIAFFKIIVVLVGIFVLCIIATVIKEVLTPSPPFLFYYDRDETEEQRHHRELIDEIRELKDTLGKRK